MLKRKKNILVISLFYYPDNRVGAKRFGNLVKFFSKYYTSVHVLTIPEGQIPVKDASISPVGVVHRVPMFPTYPMKSKNIIRRIRTRLWEKYLCMLDRYSGWLLPALIRAINIIKTEEIDVIIATAPPYTPLLVGAIASRVTGKRIILDYRDPWTTHPKKYPLPFGKPINISAEKLAFKFASAVVFCSSIMRNDFIKKFGKRKGVQSYVLTNGYIKSPNPIAPIFHNKNKVIMLYAGNFYSGRNLGIVASALSSMIQKKIISAENFEFIIYSRLPPQDIKTIQSFNLDSVISVRTPVPYHDVLKRMKGADILFLPSAEMHKYAIPYKFFDYLMVNRPILAVAPKGSAVEKLMKDIPCGHFCRIDDLNAIEMALTEMIDNKYKTYPLVSENYTWHNIATKYINIIDEL